MMTWSVRSRSCSRERFNPNTFGIEALTITSSILKDVDGLLNTHGLRRTCDRLFQELSKNAFAVGNNAYVCLKLFCKRLNDTQRTIDIPDMPSSRSQRYTNYQDEVADDYEEPTALRRKREFAT
jgi:hypothetical protein